MELIRDEVESLKIHFHEFDNIEYAFMHTSSGSRISIPYYDKRFGLQANTFHYKVKTALFQDLSSMDCEASETYQPSTSCLTNNLEKELGCKVPLDFTQGSDCPKCQLPFNYNGQTYTSCISIDADQPWCPTATYLNGEAVPYSWEFCNDNCSYLDQDHHLDDNICQSKESLHKYLRLYFDKARTNPRIIAESLKQMSCPFKCRFKEYSAELVYKKHESNLGKRRLRLILEFDGQTDIQNTFRGLLYTTDMFVSDIGSIFGLLLGISLIDVVSYIFGRVTDIFAIKNSLDKTKKRGLLIWKHVCFLVIWMCTLCYIVYLISSTVSQDLINLLPEIMSGNNDVMFPQEIRKLQESHFDVGIFKGVHHYVGVFQIPLT